MKYLFTAAVIIVIIDCLLLVSCKKDNTGNFSLNGTWQIVSDSTSISGAGPFKGGGQTYIGTPADHYTFTNDGHLYVHEGNNIDTANYVLTHTKLNLNYTYLLEGGATIQGAVGYLDISNLSNHTLTLSQIGLTPEGRQVQIITLNKY